MVKSLIKSQKFSSSCTSTMDGCLPSGDQLAVKLIDPPVISLISGEKLKYSQAGISLRVVYLYVN